MIALSLALKSRVDDILAKLAILSDAPTQKMSKAPTDRLKVEPGHWGYGGTNKASFEGNMPPGVRDNRPDRFDPETVRSGQCSAENVRRVRLDDDRDPETGLPLPREVFFDKQGKQRWAKEQSGKGMSYREIARRLRVSDSTVRAWVGKAEEWAA